MMHRYLLDTNALIWATQDPERLSKLAKQTILSQESELVVSVISIWEITIKFHLGKLPQGQFVKNDMQSALDYLGATVIMPGIDEALMAGALFPHHRDPFDRMLVAQAKHHKLTIITNDIIFKSYKLKVLW